MKDYIVTVEVAVVADNLKEAMAGAVDYFNQLDSISSDEIKEV